MLTKTDKWVELNVNSIFFCKFNIQETLRLRLEYDHCPYFLMVLNLYHTPARLPWKHPRPVLNAIRGPDPLLSPSFATDTLTSPVSEPELVEDRLGQVGVGSFRENSPSVTLVLANAFC